MRISDWSSDVCSSDLQCPAAFADQLCDQQPRNRAVVAIREVAEVVMRAHLAAVDRVLGAHALLDERVAGLALYRLAAGRGHPVAGVPAQPRVMAALCARPALEPTSREPTAEERPGG